VSPERRTRFLAELAGGATEASAISGLGEACRNVTAMTGAGIMLMSGDLPVGSVCTTGPVSELVEDLQYTLGEGPCVDAYRLGRPVLEPDLTDPAAPRWVAFTGPALDAGVRAIFSFPLGVGGVRLGALDLYADHPGRLSDDQHADAVVAAAVSAEALLALQAGESPGILATELERGLDFRYVVHQAAGMVSSQLEISVTQALVRLRAYAFGHQRLLDEVAGEVVARRLRFDTADG
jgi:GAF domain-containing protein